MYGISHAMRDASRHVLSRREETALHAAYMSGDDSAGRRLVNSFLPALYRCAYAPGMPEGYRYDLLGVAIQAFMENLFRYDPTRGHRLWTYMRLAVRHAVSAHSLANTTFFRLWPSDGSVLARLSTEKKRIGADSRRLTGSEARNMADMLGVSEHVVHGLDQNMSNMRPEQIRGDRSLQGHGIDDPERAGGHLDFEIRHDHARLMEMLKTAVACLDARQREILLRRFGDTPDTLQDLAEDMGVSRERIRQIEAAALARLRHAMENPNDMQEGKVLRGRNRYESRQECIGLDGRTYTRANPQRDMRRRTGRSRPKVRQATMMNQEGTVTSVHAR